MASEFAIGLSRALTHGVPEDILEWGQGIIDKELQEVREVLADLVELADLEGVGESDSCQRARALMEKLFVREG